MGGRTGDRTGGVAGDEARRRGLTQLSLETGSGPAFEPALALYRKHGFVDGDAFSDYEPSTFNKFLHLPLCLGSRPFSPHSGVAILPGAALLVQTAMTMAVRAEQRG